MEKYADRHKQHFVFLDGLRGVAALFVAWLHASQLFSLGFRPEHAYLAVDFFFCLSGFVIAYAYDDKLSADMAFGDFAVKRLVRLYPMVLCGVLLGGAVGLFGHSIGSAPVVFVITLASLALLPMGLMFHQQAYPINNPIWSLFFELAANAVYGLERRSLRLNAVTAALILMVFAVSLIAVVKVSHGLELVGFDTIGSFIYGFVRIAFPFFAGVCIYRYGIFGTGFSVPSIAVAIVLIVTLAAPIFRGIWGFDAVAVIVIFPGVVILGSNATHSKALTRLWTLLGKLSYPFYLIHQPILRAMNHAQKLPHLPSAVVSIFPALGILMSALGAYAIMRLYDEPVRRWLASQRSGKIAALPFAANAAL